MERVNLAEKFDRVRDYWSPKILAELNDSHVKIAKLKGNSSGIIIPARTSYSS